MTVPVVQMVGALMELLIPSPATVTLATLVLGVIVIKKTDALLATIKFITNISCA